MTTLHLAPYGMAIRIELTSDGRARVFVRDGCSWEEAGEARVERL
jgi:hypothetical protein